MTWKRPLLALLYAAALTYAALFIVTFSGHRFDDTYIHAAIAEYFAATGQPFHPQNPGHMSSTSLVWIFLSTGLFKLFGRSEIPFLFVQCISAIGVVCLLCSFYRRRHSSFSSLLFALMIVQTFLLGVAAGGMETPLAILFVFLALFFIEKNHFVSAGVFCGLAMLTRMELGVLAPICFLFVNDKKRFLRGFAAFPLFYILFTLHYYGSIFPAVISAKRIAFESDPLTFLSHFKFLDFSPAQQIPAYLSYPLQFDWRGFASICVFTAFAGYCFFKFYSFQKWEKICLLTAGTIAFSYIILDQLVFQWYWPLVTVPFFAASLSPLVRNRSFIMLFFVLASAGAWWKSALYDVSAMLKIAPENAFTFYTLNARTQAYRKIAEDLARSHPGKVLLTNEIGILSYYYPGTVIDTVGIITPESLKLYPVAEPNVRFTNTMSAVPSRFVDHFKPDFVVAMPIFTHEISDRIKNQDPPFPYKKVGTYPIFPKRALSFVGNREIQVYQRIQ